MNKINFRNKNKHFKIYLFIYFLQHSFLKPIFPVHCTLHINISKPLEVTRICSFIPPPPFPFLNSRGTDTEWVFVQMALFYQEDGASIKDSGQCSAQRRGRWDSLYKEVLERAAVFPGGGRGQPLHAPAGLLMYQQVSPHRDERQITRGPWPSLSRLVAITIGYPWGQQRLQINTQSNAADLSRSRKSVLSYFMSTPCNPGKGYISA